MLKGQKALTCRRVEGKAGRLKQKRSPYTILCISNTDKISFPAGFKMDCLRNKEHLKNI